MKEFWDINSAGIIYSLVIISVLYLFRLMLRKLAKKTGRIEGLNLTRTRLMIRYINLLIYFIGIFLLLLAWGVEVEKLTIIFSSVFAVVGVALFATWSILSNITSGVIMFFSFPYKIGDKIKIHDKEMPIEAYIEDIKAFHLHLRTSEGEFITYPNNLILQKAVSILEKEVLIDEGKDAL
ncbi:MAG TPA: mechanosensitive ion channel domain-containing protein [Salinimicrobium sp.]|nr:mechanosensitive ion channel domain-containing protein [Salinimicrobium sp.]